MARRAALLLVVVASLAIASVLSGCGSKSGSAVKLSAAGARGRAIAQDQCASCHQAGSGRSVGPGWADLAGSTVTLSNGKHVVADDAYLRRSIVDPRAQTVDGYPSIMPTTFRSLSARQVADLLAYLHDLSGKDGTPVRH